MFDDYELYQGVVLRQIIVESHAAVKVTPFERAGRCNAYVLNDTIGLFIKHSAARLSPWSFTFHIDQVADLLDLEIAHPTSFCAFVCGSDGLITLDVVTLHQLVTFEETDAAWIRVSRRPRTMYTVVGNRGQLPYKLARGSSAVVKILQETQVKHGWFDGAPKHP
jgi:hypothetical protein